MCWACFRTDAILAAALVAQELFGGYEARDMDYVTVTSARLDKGLEWGHPVSCRIFSEDLRVPWWEGIAGSGQASKDQIIQ